MIYFTSDTHFYYRKGPSEVGNRVFDSAEEKIEFLVERWNQVVKPEDEVYLLGDISNGDGVQTAEVLRRLMGRKYLVIGNNDPYLEDPGFDKSLYEWCREYYELHTMGTKFILFHFPIEVWRGYGKDRVHVHGHLHSLKPVHKPIRRYEVGVDAHDGRPVSIEEVWEAVKHLHNLSRWEYG